MNEETEQDKGQKTPVNHHPGFFEELLGDMLNLDRGLPATIWTMIKSPGQVVTAYFNERGRFTNPFRYTIILTTIATLVATYFIDYSVVYRLALEAGAGEDLDVMISKLSSEVPNYDWQLFFDRMVLISVALSEKFIQLTYLLVYAPAMAFFSYLFFKKKKQRYVQHFVMAVYMVSTYALVTIVYVPFVDSETFFSWWTYLFGMPLQLAYAYWVMYKYLDVSGLGEHVKVLLTGILGYAIFSIIVAFIMYLGAFIWTLLG